VQKPTVTKRRLGGFVSSRLFQSLALGIGVLQVGAGHRMWCRPILWHWPSERCARVWAVAAHGPERSSPGPTTCPYSPECVEGECFELRRDGVL